MMRLDISPLTGLATGLILAIVMPGANYQLPIDFWQESYNFEKQNIKQQER